MKRLKSHEILITVRDVLKDDADLTAWCVANYGAKQNIYCGINNEDPPNDSKYPLLAIFYVSRRKSANVSVISYAIELAAVVKDNDVTEAENSFTYEGILHVAEFRELAELAIEKSQAKFGKVDFNSDTWDEMLFPIFTSNTIIEFERPKNYSGPIR